MSQHAKTPDLAREFEARSDRVGEKLAGEPLALIPAIHRQLPEKDDWNLRGLIALRRLRQILTLDLACAQRNVSNQRACRGVCKDRRAGHVELLIAFRMTAEPLIDRVETAIEIFNAIILAERARRI